MLEKKKDSAHFNPLDPRYFLPDERSFSDFLKFVNQISKRVQFIDQNLNSGGDWYDFFISDELFLLAEIDSFDLNKIEKDRTSILLKFENSDNKEEKEVLFIQLFNQINLMLLTINEWYLLSSKFNKERQSTALENELVAAISYRCKEVYGQLLFIQQALEKANIELNLNMPKTNFHPLWHKGLDMDKYIGLGIETKLSDIDYLFKQLLLLHRPVYKTLVNLIGSSGRFIQDNLNHKEDHQPHIGLLLSFFHLFQSLQEKFNDLPLKILNFYYQEVLGQKFIPQRPDTVFCYVIPDPELQHQEISIPANTRLLAGQNDDGEDMMYALTEKVRVSPINLARIHTLFVSKNKLIDPGTSFQTVSGIFSSYIDPNEPITPFSALGEEQRFLSDEARTMADVYLGFMISSPTFKMNGGKRKVQIYFKFLEESFQYFLAMLLSAAKFRKSPPEEIFRQLLMESLVLQYTGKEDWHTVPQYEVSPPQNWNEYGFTLHFELDPSMPGFTFYDEEVHQANIDLCQPTLKVLLKNESVFHPYSFLQFLELQQVKIKVDVSQLKDLTLHSNFGPIDQSIPFDLLGPTPKKGSYLLLGNEEVFSKDLDEIKIGWEFYGLPEEEDIESYFGGYPFGIKNDSFKIQIQALSDFRFIPSDPNNAIITDLFTHNEGLIDKRRHIEKINLSQLNIQPDYRLGLAEEALRPDGQTGFFKLELIGPSMGFGFDVYAEVYNKSVTMSTNKQLEKPREGFTFEVPKEPFSPMAKDMFIDYKASSEINFLGSMSFSNQTEKGETCIQIHPFGKKYLVKEGLVYDNRLLPFFELQGGLFLGFETKNMPEEFSLLFDIGKNKNWVHGNIPSLDWFYLSSDEWKPFKPDDLLFDTTIGLTRSGIISFKSPKDINTNNVLMPKSYFWICCRSLENAELASKVSGIYPNAFSAEAVLVEGRVHPPTLEAFRIQSFEQDIPGILELIQPIPSIGGKAAEDQMAFFNRVSQSIKHKYRPATHYDIEKLLLNQFDWLGLVRVFGAFENKKHVKPGFIYVVGIPKIMADSEFYLPRLNPGQIKEIDYFLQAILSPFMRYEVINPEYEYLLIKGKIKFTSENKGLAFQSLYRDLLAEICPWFYGDLSDVFENRETKKSEILNLIISRSYVRFFTGYSIAHIYQNDNDEYVFIDAAKLEDGMDQVNVGKPWSILVPYQLNNIEIIEEEKYMPPEAFDLHDFTLGENLIVTSEYTEAFKEPIKTENKPEEEEDLQITLDI